MVTAPPVVVTTMSFTPVLRAGVSAVMEPAVATTLVAATPSTVTPVTVDKLVPVIVICVPPAVGPKVGETVEIVGAET